MALNEQCKFKVTFSEKVEFNSKLKAELSEANAEINKRGEQIIEQQNEISAKQAEIEAKQAEIEAQQSVIEEQRKEIESMLKGSELYSNALKGNKSGEAVACDDVSPIEHTMKVKASGEGIDLSTAKVMRYGKNLFDEQLEIGGINTSTGANDDTVTTTLRTTNYIKVLPSTVYFVACPTGLTTTGGLLQIYRYDKDKNFLGYGSTGIENTTLRTGADWQYIRFVIRAEYGTVYKNDICLTMGSTATDYEPSQKITYPISADGTVDGVESLYPTTTLMADTPGIVIDVEYNRDINKAFAELQSAITT